MGMKSNAKEVADSIKKVEKKIRKKTVPSGLDKEMKKSLAIFKKNLTAALDQIVERAKIVDPLGEFPEQKTSLPKNDRDVLQFMLSKTSELQQDRYKPGVSNFYNNVHFIQNWNTGPHLRVTVPAKRTDSLPSLFTSAVESFANGVIVYTLAGENRYFILSNAGRAAILDYAKKVCSRYSGPDSLRKKETQKRRRSEIEKGLNTSTWAIKQEFVEKIVKGQDGFGIEITQLVKDLKYGNIEEAETTLANLEAQAPNTLKPAVNKVRKLKETKSTIGEQSPYVKVTEIAKSAFLQKKVEENTGVTYAIVLGQVQTELQSSDIVIQNQNLAQSYEIERFSRQDSQISNQQTWEDALRAALREWLTVKELDLVVQYTKILIQDITEELGE